MSYTATEHDEAEFVSEFLGADFTKQEDLRRVASFLFRKMARAGGSASPVPTTPNSGPTLPPTLPSPSELPEYPFSGPLTVGSCVSVVDGVAHLATASLGDGSRLGDGVVESFVLRGSTAFARIITHGWAACLFSSTTQRPVRVGRLYLSAEAGCLTPAYDAGGSGVLQSCGLLVREHGNFGLFIANFSPASNIS
jgi:hypothetical protein